MSDILITRIQAVDAELLAAFEHLMPQLTAARKPSTAELNEILASPSVLIVARLSTGAPIIGAGTLGVFRSPSGLHGHLEDIIVDEQVREQGVGEALVKYLLASASEMGLKGVSLTCNPRRVAANHLYRKMGFKKWATNAYWYDL